MLALLKVKYATKCAQRVALLDARSEQESFRGEGENRAEDAASTTAPTNTACKTSCGESAQRLAPPRTFG